MMRWAERLAVGVVVTAVGAEVVEGSGVGVLGGQAALEHACLAASRNISAHVCDGCATTDSMSSSMFAKDYRLSCCL